MEPLPSADEGEPGKPGSYFSNLFIVVLIITTFASCHRQKPRTVLPPKTDSADLQQQTRIRDSVARPKIAKKKIYITFDDGPNRGTKQVLKVVKEENIPVSFFIVGKHVFDSPGQTALYNEMREDSTIELCNHSFTHALNKYTKFYSDPEAVVNDFKTSDTRLHFTNKVARMPGRNAWRIDTIDITDIRQSKPAIDSLHQAGFAIMGWDIEWSFDHKTFVPDQDTGLLLRKIYNLLDANTTRTPGHLVLLAHDQAFQDEDNLAILYSFLKELKLNEQYEFELASKYPGVKE
jgi:peptidoglycan-N-acetylglucosamine deacetylase